MQIISVKRIVYVRRDRDCDYSRLIKTHYLPQLSQITGSAGKTVREKVKNWLLANWYKSIPILRYLSDFEKTTPATGTFTYCVKSDAFKEALYGVFEFVEENKDTIKHLHAAFTEEDKSKIPEISRVFNGMSFQERQAILKGSNEAFLEEIKPS